MGNQYTFGGFRLDVERQTLFCGSEEIPLNIRLLDTLRLLLDSEGEVVSKDDLLNQVWPERVVSETNLTQAISLLRRIFADRDPGEDYIVTHSGRGYQFVIPVTRQEIDDRGEALTLYESGTPQPLDTGRIEIIPAERDPADAPPSDGHPEPGLTEAHRETESHRESEASLPHETLSVENSVATPEAGMVGQGDAPGRESWRSFLSFPKLRSRLRWRFVSLCSLIAISLFVALVLLLFTPILGGWTEGGRLVPFKGANSMPSLSADGKRLAFINSRAPGDEDLLYVREMEEGVAHAISLPSGVLASPAWSPDGSRLAVLRQTLQGCDVLLLDARTESLQNRFAISSECSTTHRTLAWMPDGDRLVVSSKASPDEAAGLFCFRADGSESKVVTAPPADILGDFDPVVSPDGTKVSFVRLYRPHRSSLCESDLTTGKERCISMIPMEIRDHINDFSSPVLFLMPNGQGGAIHEIPADWSENSVPKFVPALRHVSAGYFVRNPRTQELIYSDAFLDLDIAAASFADPLGAANTASAELPATRLLNWKSTEMFPSVSSDGTLLAFLSDYESGLSLWAMDLNSRRVLRLTQSPVSAGIPIAIEGARSFLSVDRTNGEILSFAFGQFPVFQVSVLPFRVDQPRSGATADELIGVQDGNVVSINRTTGSTKKLFRGVPSDLTTSSQLPGVFYTMTRNAAPIFWWRPEEESERLITDLFPTCHLCWTIRGTTLYYLRRSAESLQNAELCLVSLQGVRSQKCVGSIYLGNVPPGDGFLSVDERNQKFYYTRAATSRIGNIWVTSKRRASIAELIVGGWTR